jgi:DNA polymerase III epsilon subunit-like protein
MDLELNQPFHESGKTKQNPICRFEIMQIGAVKLDDEFRTVQTADFLVKPTLYKRIHPYVRKITKLSASALKNAETFPAVYEKLLRFIGPAEYVFCVWGGSSDIRDLYKNIAVNNLDAAAVSSEFIDVQAIASRFTNAPKGKSLGLGAAVEKLNIPVAAPFHNALHDAQYTAEILRLLKDEERTVQSLNMETLWRTSGRKRRRQAP